MSRSSSVRKQRGDFPGPERRDQRRQSPRQRDDRRGRSRAERIGGEGAGHWQKDDRTRPYEPATRQRWRDRNGDRDRDHQPRRRHDRSEQRAPVQGRRRREDQWRPDSEPAAGESFGHQPETEAVVAEDLVWGRHAAEAALHGQRPIHRIWCTPELRFNIRFMQLLREAKSAGVVVEEVAWARLAQLCNGAIHQGIVLQIAAARTVALEALIAHCTQSDETPLLVAVDGITDPHNLGAIVRTAEAFAAQGVVVPQRRNAGLTGSVAKVAAGALEHLPVARVVNLNRSLEQLKQAGYTVVGLTEEGGLSIVEVPANDRLVVVTGSEGSGLSLMTRKHCDLLVRIPLRGEIPSLNASVASGVMLYEIARQRWLGKLTGTMPAPPRPQRWVAAATLPVEPTASLTPLPEARPTAVETPDPAAETALADPVDTRPAPQKAPVTAEAAAVDEAASADNQVPPPGTADHADNPSLEATPAAAVETPELAQRRR